jgi:predicted rRNA methylase YqxC with S4 and FtsJ domains
MDSEELYAAILCGEIYVNGERVRDPKARMPLDGNLERRVDKFVGRGGYKLEGALDDLGLDPTAWSAWTPGPPQEALPTVCYPGVP